SKRGTRIGAKGFAVKCDVDLINVHAQRRPGNGGPHSSGMIREPNACAITRAHFLHYVESDGDRRARISSRALHHAKFVAVALHPVHGAVEFAPVTHAG